MSSDFAEFLFSFACNKLESDPQLDLRQQLLHSNLIRHILLLHNNDTTNNSNSNSNSNSSNSSNSSNNNHHHQQDCLPPLPPSPLLTPAPSSSAPQSLQQQPFVFASPQPSFNHPWSPFSFDDELDRIDSHSSADRPLDQMQIHFQDLDVDMTEDDPSDQIIFPNLYNEYSFPLYAEAQHHHKHVAQINGDFDYDFESSQAQEDWLDAVLEDLMEEDGQDSENENNNDHDDDSEDSFGDSSFGDTDLDLDITTQGPSANGPVVLAHTTDHNGGGVEDAVLDHLLDQSGRHILQHQQHYPQRQHSPSPAATYVPLLQPCQSMDMFVSSHESPHPYRQSYLHQAFPSKEKGSTTTNQTTTTTAAPAAPVIGTTTSSCSSSSSSCSNASSSPSSRPLLLLAKGVHLDEPMYSQDDHVSRLKQQLQLQQRHLYFEDDAYYRACPPCLGFHSSSRCSSSQRRQRQEQEEQDEEEALREQRFVQLTQELGSTASMIQEQQLQQQESVPNAAATAPLSEHKYQHQHQQQHQPMLSSLSYEDSLVFRSSPASGHPPFLLTALGH